MEPVIYTQPRAFNRSRLMIQLISIMAVVMALILCLSIFFRVETITVSGANAYSAWAVRDASGIQEGDYLLTFSRARAVARIEAELPYVYSARIGIKLPNTVNIVIEELDVVYAIQDTTGLWWLISSEGKVVEMTDLGAAANYTKVEGVKIQDPIQGQIAAAEDDGVTPTAQTDAAGEVVGTVPVLVTNAERLEAALRILRELERNDEVGTAASINVADIANIQLWYGSQYDVRLGDNSRLDYKIACMCAAIDSPEMATGYGVLDVSFIIWEDQVGYTPFT
jgi:cell division protein FtsQ